MKSNGIKLIDVDPIDTGESDALIAKRLADECENYRDSTAYKADVLNGRLKKLCARCGTHLAYPGEQCKEWLKREGERNLHRAYPAAKLDDMLRRKGVRRKFEHELEQCKELQTWSGEMLGHSPLRCHLSFGHTGDCMFTWPCEEKTVDEVGEESARILGIIPNPRVTA